MTNIPATAQQTMALINSTPVLQIPEMDHVRNQYIQNYEKCNPGKDGAFEYQRNLVHLMAILNSNDAFKKCNPFSVYQCLTTIAAYGYSVDPADDHIYLIPRDGKLCISRQPGSKLLRLIKTNQVVIAGEPTLVYEGDTYEVEDGMVKKHVEKFSSDKIIAGYVKFTLDSKGTQRHIRYRISDWEGWRLKSPQATGGNWRWMGKDQPHPGFLRTKIMGHACTERCWIPGNYPNQAEAYDDLIIDAGDGDYEIINEAKQVHQVVQPTQQPESQPAQKQTAATNTHPVTATKPKDEYEF